MRRYEGARRAAIHLVNYRTLYIAASLI
jgi:hypothetical protein